MYVDVNIVTTKNTALSLPTEAIIKSGNYNYVLQKDKEKNDNYYFTKKPIKTGMSVNGFTEIVGDKNLPFSALGQFVGWEILKSFNNWICSS
jgi:hypothetical protein